VPAHQDIDKELKALRKRVAELEGFEARYKEAEMVVKEANHGWENLLEAVGDSIFVVDPTNQTILDTNAHAARRLGYTRAELLDTPYASVEVRPDGERSSSPIWESDMSRTSFYECVHMRKDHTPIPVEVSSRIIKHHGRAALLKVARDISLRKQVEAEREQMILELDAYAQTVAHDLKNPVAILMGYSELLANPEALEPHEIVLSARTIHQAAAKMSRIIEELLLLASVRNKQELRIESLDMQMVAGEALKRLEYMLETAGATVIQEDRWPDSVGYAPWVEEVWANYISNAVKYGGSPPSIELGGTLRDGVAYYWVRDNGPGIPADLQAKLFEPFSRLNPTKAEGHGLGLSIVKSIITKLGGDVGAVSSPGQGSEFYFTLPAAP
jgi:PAS domain S-box-containing protein